VAAALLGAPAAGRAAAPKGHNQTFSKRWFHGPVADDNCTVCHTVHGDGVDKALTAPVPKLCYQCHEDVAAKDVVHEPVGAGRCTDCHEVHTSDVRPLLVRKVPELCLGCHSLDEQHKTRGTVCTGCHGVHSSETSRFLDGGQSRNCGQCHKDKREGEWVHAPAREGKCLSCHFTHPDPRFRVQRFRAQFPSGPDAATAKQGRDSFALCDGCHPQALHVDPAYRGTGFRTAKLNLHERHVRSEKGFSCSVCHDLHSTRRPALMEEWVRLPGKQSKPMQFLRFTGGGTCGPVCHAPATYLCDEQAEFGEEE
jgi:predicted CXXCH cytochrome family protein